MKATKQIKTVITSLFLLISIQGFSQDSLHTQQWWLPEAFSTCRDIYDSMLMIDFIPYPLDNHLYHSLEAGDTLTDYMQQYDCDSSIRLSGLVFVNVPNLNISFRLIDVATDNVITALYNPEPSTSGQLSYNTAFVQLKFYEYMFDSIVTVTDDFYVSVWLAAPYYDSLGHNIYQDRSFCLGYLRSIYSNNDIIITPCNSGKAALFRYSDGRTKPILQALLERFNNNEFENQLNRLGIGKSYLCDLGLFPIFAEEDETSGGEGENGDGSSDSTSALPSVEVEKYTSVFPNPANGSLNVVCSYKVKSYCILNALGQEIRSENSNANTLNINLDGLESGAYFIKITTDKGSATKRFIVQ